jgi:hypothetical protein
MVLKNKLLVLELYLQWTKLPKPWLISAGLIHFNAKKDSHQKGWDVRACNQFMMSSIPWKHRSLFSAHPCSLAHYHVCDEMVLLLCDGRARSRLFKLLSFSMLWISNGQLRKLKAIIYIAWIMKDVMEIHHKSVSAHRRLRKREAQNK